MHRALFILLAVLTITALEAQAQRYMTRNGVVRLTYNVPTGPVSTENRQVNVALNVETGELRMRMAMLSFRFRSAFNQEKYNEYFQENPQFANSSFVGHIVNIDEVDFDRPGTYQVHVKGDLTLRQVTNSISTTADFVVQDDLFSGEASFVLGLRDFQIYMPSGMPQSIQVSMDVNVRRL